MKLGGILPAVVTPLDGDGRFSPAAFEALLGRCYAAGCHGIYVNGFTGEGLQQSVAQRKQVAETAIQASPAGKQVVLHVGAASTGDAVELARHASRAGATAVSSLPPQGPYSFVEVKEYYRALAEASDVPLLVYFFPEICPVLANVDHLLELIGLPNVVGLKFTDFDLYKMMRLRQHCQCIYNGRDEILAAGLLMGADGGIGTFYNLVPELFVDLYEASQVRDWGLAVDLQKTIDELITIVLRYPAIGAVKKILTWTGIECGSPIGPRASLSPTEERALAADLASYEPLAGLIAGAATA